MAEITRSHGQFQGCRRPRRRSRWVAQLAGRFEQRAAQVLEQAETVGGHGQPAQPREAGSSTAQTKVRQLVSPGSLPMTLTRRRVSPKVLSMKFGVADAVVLLGGEPQVGGEAFPVDDQASHRRGIGSRGASAGIPPVNKPCDAFTARPVRFSPPHRCPASRDAPVATRARRRPRSRALLRERSGHPMTW